MPRADRENGRGYHFLDVAVVSMTDPVARPGQTVVVQDGRIRDLGPAAAVAIPAGSTPIDGTGRFLLPGLVDMHVHLGDSLDDLALYLVNGVTTIRNMWGFERFQLSRWLM